MLYYKHLKFFDDLSILTCDEKMALLKYYINIILPIAETPVVMSLLKFYFFDSCYINLIACLFVIVLGYFICASGNLSILIIVSCFSLSKLEKDLYKHVRNILVILLVIFATIYNSVILSWGFGFATTRFCLTSIDSFIGIIRIK